MPLVRLIHWNAVEAEERAEWLRAAGHEVVCNVPRGADFLRRLRDSPPAAVVIDLARLPIQGRDMGLGIRHSKATRFIPLVFVGGEDPKVARVKEALPDAVYTSWARIRSSLKQAIAHPPARPVVPRSLLDGYSGTHLPKKLGIKTSSIVGLIDAPEGFRGILGDLPSGAKVRDDAGGRCDLIIWFVRSGRELEIGIQGLAARTDYAAVWIAWPKKGSNLASDLSQQYVREAGLAAGLIDYKICAIDATWSGLLFARRKPGRP